MNSFIKTLKNEGKLKIVEPSQEIADSYLGKSATSLLSAKTLLNVGNYDDAIALTYYSMYYSALALLYRCGVKSENHVGTIILLKEIFGIDNTELALAKKERVDKQYYVDFSAKKEELEKAIITAEDWNALLKDKLDKIKQSEIQKYFAKAKKMLN